MTGFLIRLPLLTVHHCWCGNWLELIHSELRQASPNVAVLIDVDLIMLLIELNVPDEIDENSPKTMYPELLLGLFLDQPC
jgi:hypothetical protein